MKTRRRLAEIIIALFKMLQNLGRGLKKASIEFFTSIIIVWRLVIFFRINNK